MPHLHWHLQRPICPAWSGLLAVVLLCLGNGAAQALTVQLLGLTPGSAPFVTALQSRLGAAHQLVSQPEAGADVVVPLHEGVLAEARATRRPLLLLQAAAGSVALGEQESAIYWAPSLSDQIRLARKIMPGLRRVGLLAGPPELARAQALRAALAAQRIELIVQPAAPARLARQVAELAGSVDVMLAPVDPQLFNRDTVKALLLAAYRQGRVFIGPNAAYVRAGALASLQATPEALADSVAAAVRVYARDGAWPSPALVNQFDVVTNPQVARALGLRLPEAAALSRAMQSEKGVTWP